MYFELGIQVMKCQINGYFRIMHPLCFIVDGLFGHFVMGEVKNLLHAQHLFEIRSNIVSCFLFKWSLN